jgi:protocatechuate 3,4-dioxygenase beta subunit
MMSIFNRRNLLAKTILGVGAISLVPGKARAENLCRLTATQPEGPFYPEKYPMDRDNDLTKVGSSTKEALGEVVYLKGTVRDNSCKPVAGAIVEIWQACDSGKYNHSQDPNDAKLDPNFQYWGRAITNESGEYVFKTIKPGEYQATGTWRRPPHIHLKVHLRGYRELISQVYFKENLELNLKDRILMGLDEHDQKNAIVEFKKSANLKNRVGSFDINLELLL